MLLGHAGLIRKLPSVLSTRVGNSGGEVPDATYRNHRYHAEAIEIVYDPAETNYRALLELLFQIHDPTTLNRQGNDRGASYRSAIFYADDAQKRIAKDTIADGRQHAVADAPTAFSAAHRDGRPLHVALQILTHAPRTMAAGEDQEAVACRLPNGQRPPVGFRRTPGG